MTPHPAKAAGCTKRQIEVFEQICIGQIPDAAPATLNVLLSKKLVECERETVGKDRFGPITLPHWSVSIPIHMQWCQWCSEQPESE